MSEPVEFVKCEKRGKIIAEPKELIRITNSNIIGSKDYQVFGIN
jgi:hypothetical protein